jgi:hypothetical protein
MNNYFGLGRVDTSTDTKFKNKHNLTKNTESSTNVISRTYEIDDLTGLFFSNDNVNLLHEDIRKYIYFNTKNNSIIAKQSDIELKIIMKSIYLSNRPKLTDFKNIIEQVKFLNKTVILECARIIKTNLSQHLHYVKELNSMPQFQELPKNVSSKGTKNLEMYK